MNQDGEFSQGLASGESFAKLYIERVIDRPPLRFAQKRCGARVISGGPSLVSVDSAE
jgi:hypothetical protein